MLKCKNLIVLAIIFCTGAAFGGEKPLVISIKPETEYNLHGDDIARLKELAAGVGGEFSPNAKTNEGLKLMGTRHLRLINVNLGGIFDSKGQFKIGRNHRMDANLATCRAVGAKPHIIIINGLLKDLRTTAKDLGDISDKRMFGLLQSRVYGPNDWGKFRSWVKAHFQYVLIDKGFSDAVFEIGNEPDIGGMFTEKPPRNGMGSKRQFDAYFKLYKNVSEVAREFEKENPGVKVTIGGPGLSWVFTFKFGAFNWTQRFLRMVGKEKLKLDFIGVHFYGNNNVLTGKSQAVYPSFQDMMRMTCKWRDEYTPGVPVYVTEWGASYKCNLTPSSVINATNVGAAFTAAFLNRMMTDGLVEKALYLVTTDLCKKIDGKMQTVWGWPSLFTSPVIGTHPKAPYHVFQMVKHMKDRRVKVSKLMGDIGCIASRDESGRLTAMIWQFTRSDYNYGEASKAKTDKINNIKLRIGSADSFFKGPVQMKRRLISRTKSNAYYLFKKGEELDKRADLQVVETKTLKPVDGVLDISFDLPDYSVTLLEIAPASQKQIAEKWFVTEIEKSNVKKIKKLWTEYRKSKPPKKPFADIWVEGETGKSNVNYIASKKACYNGKYRVLETKKAPGADGYYFQYEIVVPENLAGNFNLFAACGPIGTGHVSPVELYVDGKLLRTITRAPNSRGVSAWGIGAVGWNDLGPLDLTPGKHTIKFVVRKTRPMGDGFYFQAFDAIALVHEKNFKTGAK